MKDLSPIYRTRRPVWLLSGFWFSKQKLCLRLKGGSYLRTSMASCVAPAPIPRRDYGTDRHPADPARHLRSPSNEGRYRRSSWASPVSRPAYSNGGRRAYRCIASGTRAKCVGSVHDRTRGPGATSRSHKAVAHAEQSADPGDRSADLAEARPSRASGRPRCGPVNETNA